MNQFQEQPDGGDGGDGGDVDLDDRKAAILKAVVEEYVHTAQPVGSQAIADSSQLGVSSATVRNELTLLERDGYLVQPHTSAGRVPTDRGYRYFVDHFTGQGSLPVGQRRAVAEFFSSTHQALEDLLHETSQLLARVTSHAGLVMGPESQSARVRNVQVVPLQPGIALVVMVLSNGVVEKEVVQLSGLGAEAGADLEDVDEAALTTVSAVLSSQLVGHERARLPELGPTADPATDAIAAMVHGVMTRGLDDPGSEALYVGGVSNLAAEQDAFATAKTAARLLEMLEAQVVVVSLVRELLERGLSVSIGTENPLDELRDCAIVLAPYRVDGRPAGIVGVMGPTRMDYRHALAAVSAVSDQLGRHSLVSFDPYAVLGVARNATDAEIKRAFRELARRYHPDGNPSDAEAEERFKEVSLAYELLSDPERRRRYDLFGEGPGARGTAPPGDYGFGDLFDAFFGGDVFGSRGGPMPGPPRGGDAEVAIELTLAEAAFGTTYALEIGVPIACERCDGSGCEPGTHPSRCDGCGGSGEVRQMRRSLLGQIVTAAVCSACHGSGRRILDPCHQCRGEGRVRGRRSIDVDVPAGIDHGQRLRLAGRGEAAPWGGPSGDLFVTVHIAPHPGLERAGTDLMAVVGVSIAQATLGTRLVVAGLDAEHDLEVPPGTQPGTVFRVKGAGVPVLGRRGRGDLLVRVEVQVPTRLSDEEAALVARLAELRGEDVSEPDRGMLSRLRSAFQ